MIEHREPEPRFAVLGQMQVCRGETPLTLGSVQQQVVLAVLLFWANRPIGRQQLIDGVWAAPPAYALNLIQKHISDLRRLLEPERTARRPSQLLRWTAAGYLLTVSPGWLDLEAFDRGLELARTARAAGDLAGAAATLHRALGLWRGPACDGLSSPLLDTERTLLHERRISAVEDSLETDLRLGGDVQLVTELRRMVAEHPLRERLHELLMLALYRAGRRAEALAAFHQARCVLRDEVGVEPGAALERLHQQILTADENLAPPPAAPGAVAAPLTVLEPPTPAPDPLPPGTAAPGPRPPAQLPHGASAWTGRRAELDRLDTLAAGPGPVVITAIAGTAGVGKTVLVKPSSCSTH